MRLAVAASGALGLHCLNALPGFIELDCVFTDSGSAAIIDWCVARKIPFYKGNPRNGKAASFITQHKPEILFSINYLFVIERDLIEWPSKFAFNIHGSLLPEYRGRTPHVWAIINGETKTGLTVHLIDEGCDTGDIVLQQEIAIGRSMTGADVLDIFNREYPKVVAEVLSKVKEGTITTVPQDASKATYFGKRTPEDGLIDWNWKSERIYNWVRAQARPYPGAFGFYDDSKIIIHKVSFDDRDLDPSVLNGTVLSVANGIPVVKTSDGALQLEVLETTGAVQFKTGASFHAGYIN